MSTVDELVCKNVKINGKLITDVEKEICVISFPDDMYDGQYGKGGKGEIKVVKLKKSIKSKYSFYKITHPCTR